MSVIDTQTNTKVADIGVGQAPVQVGCSPDGKYVYFSLNGENALGKVEVATQSVVGKVAVGVGPVQVFVAPDDKYVLVANQGTKQNPSTTVSIVDTNTFKVVSTLETGTGAEFEGCAEEIFEGVTMVLAAGLLTWMIIWMRRQSAGMQQELEQGVTDATAGQENRWALFWLAFFAVGREGLELVLFLTAVQMTSDAFQTWIGALFGLTASFALGTALFASSKRMSLRTFFNVTNILLVLFAAGLLAHGVHEFNEARIIPPVIEHVWDVNPLLNEKGTIGQLLTALFGYNGNPALTEILAYIAYFAGAWALWTKPKTAPLRRVVA